MLVCSFVGILVKAFSGTNVFRARTRVPWKVDKAVMEDRSFADERSPTQSNLVLANRAPEQLAAFRWSLVPFLIKDLKIGGHMGDG